MITYENAEIYLQKKGISYKIGSVGKQLYIHCPFCQSNSPACTIQNSTGLFCCFKCGAGGKWLGLAEKFGDPQAILPKQKTKVEQEEYDLQPIDPNIIKENHERLLHSVQPVLDWLHKRGLTNDTIRKFKLGWNGRSITIPVLMPTIIA